MTAGVPYPAVWDFTLAELHGLVRVAERRERLDYERRVSQAWLVAALVRAPELPPLDELLRRSGGRRVTFAAKRRPRQK
ncbi:MAG: hypothetical protein NZM12_10940 [Steroidobacteraceae bacterium]|nr:hypothetical protein [Steroidobacteraceae bacterium]MDW8260769.1 hypothetical protein [Gammaproteobacteria bacterium]